MPDKLRFEPQDNLTGQDFSFRKNKEMNTAQANETFVVDARFNRSLGENGEVMGFAKRQFSNAAGLLEQREQAFQAIQETYLELLAHPAVQEWKSDRYDLENLDALRGGIPNQVNEARARLETLQQAGAAKDKLDDAQSKLACQERRLARNPLVTQDPAAEKQRLQQVARDTPQVAAFIKADEQYKAANSLKTSGEAIAESSSHLYENMRLMNNPETPGDRQLLARAVASYAADKALGLQICAQEKFGLDAQGALVGISIQCDGAGVKSGQKNGYGETVDAFLDIDYSDPRIQKGLHDLETLDYITGQTDRHAGNIFVDPESGKVTGIDNDLAFPEIDRRELLERGGSKLHCKAVTDVPRMMHAETAAKLEAVQPAALRAALEAVRPPDGSQGLGEEQIAGALRRLGELKAAISKSRNEGGPLKIVQEFNAETYQEAVKTQQQVGLGGSSKITSYIGTVESIRANCLHAQQNGLDNYVTRSADQVGKAKINPQYAAYLQMSDQQKEAYHGVQARIEHLEENLAAVRKDMARLEHPSFKDRLTALKHGGVDSTRQRLLASDSQLVKDLQKCMTELREMDGTAELEKAQEQAQAPQIQAWVRADPVQRAANQANAAPAVAQAPQAQGWVRAQVPQRAANLAEAANNVGQPQVQAAAPPPRAADLDNLANGPDQPKAQKNRIPAKDKNLGLEGTPAPHRASVGDILHIDHAHAAGPALAQSHRHTASTPTAAVPDAVPSAGKTKSLRESAQWQQVRKPGPVQGAPAPGNHH